MLNADLDRKNNNTEMQEKRKEITSRFHYVQKLQNVLSNSSKIFLMLKF